MNFIENLGYIFMIIVVTGICFWQYLKTMNEREADILASSGLSRKEIRAKMRARKKNIWLLGAIVLVWLISVIAAFGGSGYFFALILSAAACIAIWYSLSNTDTLQLIAMKFLIAPVGLAVGFYLGKMLNLPGAWTYILGLIGAAGFVVITHLIHNTMFDDLDDDEDEEAPAETPARNQVASATPNRVTTNRTTSTRHRRTQAVRDDSDHAFDAYIIEELSKTEEGRQQLIDMLRRGR